ncbi:Aspartic peptidase, partial [Trema orientale]
MARASRSGVLVAATLLQAAAVLYSFPATMTLERAFPTNHGVELSQLRARDSIRHGRALQSTGGGGVIDFPVGGTFNPFLVGLYFTTVNLGSPPREFYVQIDTGSDVLWVGCSRCNGCPRSSGLKIQLNSFDPGSSSTSSLVHCSDQICGFGLESADSVCSGQNSNSNYNNNSQCLYSLEYGDGSGTSGYYVSDLLHFDTIAGDSANSNSSASIVFGCSTSATGDLTKSDRAVDGIFGFGQDKMSVISQLSSQGVAPKVFSHCLSGDDSGGGILVLGEIVEPNIVYTPLVPSQPHYNLNLLNITVNGQVVPVDSGEFTTSSTKGTIVDSGTTLAYLAQKAYDPFVNAITSAASQDVTPVTVQGSQCYVVTSSITNNMFPQVSFNFAGNASMVLGPQDYLIQEGTSNGDGIWCIGFQKNDGQDTTILGDLVLKDRIVVYDLAGQRIGWADYDCSMSVNVSANSSTGIESVNMGPRNISSSFRKEPPNLMIPISIVTLVV